jgi:hypothetical protein
VEYFLSEVRKAAVNEAVAHVEQLIVFPEAFIPGFPTFIWGLRPGLWAEGTVQLPDQIV